MADPGFLVPKLLVKVDGERLKALPLAPLDGFVLSRIDGQLNVEELGAITGLSTAQVMASLTKLRQLKLVDVIDPAQPQPAQAQRPSRVSIPPIPRNTPPAPPPTPIPRTPSPRPIPRQSQPPRSIPRNTPPAPPPRSAPRQPSAPPRSIPRNTPPAPKPPPSQAQPPKPPPIPPPPQPDRPRRAPSPPPPPPAPAAVTSPSASTTIPEAGVELEEAHQHAIEDLFSRVNGSDLDHYAVLSVPRSADKKAIKRAYFELAAKFHPDKFFRKNLGSFKLKMESIFRKITEAHETLTSKQQRAEYDAYLASVEKTRGIEAMLEESKAEVKRAEEEARRSASSSPPPPPSSVRSEPRAPSPAPMAQSPVPAPRIDSAPTRSVPSSSPNLGAFIADALGGAPRPSASPEPRISVPAANRISIGPSKSEPPQARRDVLARRLMGGSGMRVPAAPKVPTVQYSSPTEAVDALKRRYDDKMTAARSSQSRKYAESGAQERAKKDYVAAANAYRVALSFDPDNEELKKEAEETQRLADEILSEGYLKQALYEERSEHWAEAAKSWARVARARPNDANAHEHAAQCLMKANGNLHEAVALAQRATALSPKNAEPRVTLANVYLAAGLQLNAKRELEAAAQLSPDDPTIQALLKRVAKGGP